MFASELFWNNKRGISTLQKELTDFLTPIIIGNLKSLEPKKVEQETLIDVANIGLLRMNSSKLSYAVCVGTNQIDFDKILYPQLKPDAENKPIEKKDFETGILKALYKAIEPEHKANQINLNPNSIINLPSALLGPWNKIQINKLVRFSFETDKGVLSFDIPVFDSEFHKKFMITNSGFNEEARILVVDDSATTRKLSRYCLASGGYINVDEVVDGQAAYTKIISTRPQYELIVCDWHMPNMTGFELLKKIRSTEGFEKISFIMATGERNQEEIINAIKSGVSGYIVKPFDVPTVLKAMKGAKQFSAKATQNTK